MFLEIYHTRNQNAGFTIHQKCQFPAKLRQSHLLVLINWEVLLLSFCEIMLCELRASLSYMSPAIRWLLMTASKHHGQFISRKLNNMTYILLVLVGETG